MRILEGACPQLMAEEHGKGEWMRPHGKSHGKQAGSVTDVEFEGFHMVCDILPNPGVRRGGNSRSGSGRGPGLVREAESCSAIPFPGEGIAHPGFLAENSQPFPVSGMWLWLPSFPCNIPWRGNQFNGSASHFHRSHLRTLPTSLCTFPRAGMIWESSSPCAEPSACPGGLGQFLWIFPRERGGLEFLACSSQRLPPCA